jgi:hypothetical protein
MAPGCGRPGLWRARAARAGGRIAAHGIGAAFGATGEAGHVGGCAGEGDGGAVRRAPLVISVHPQPACLPPRFWLPPHDGWRLQGLIDRGDAGETRSRGGRGWSASCRGSRSWPRHSCMSRRGHTARRPRRCATRTRRRPPRSAAGGCDRDPCCPPSIRTHTHARARTHTSHVCLTCV